MKELNFGIDYDGTWNRDSEVFRDIAGLLVDRGHNVWIVTNRQPRQRKQVEEDVLQAVDIEGIKFCGEIPKRQFMKDHGINIDIWIDNNPESVFGLQSMR